MSVLIILISISIFMGCLWLLICLRAIQKGQFQNLESHKWQLIIDHNPPQKERHSGMESTNENH